MSMYALSKTTADRPTETNVAGRKVSCGTIRVNSMFIRVILRLLWPPLSWLLRHLWFLYWSKGGSRSDFGHQCWMPAWYQLGLLRHKFRITDKVDLVLTSQLVGLRSRSQILKHLTLKMEALLYVRWSLHFLMFFVLRTCCHYSLLRDYLINGL